MPPRTLRHYGAFARTRRAKFLPRLECIKYGLSTNLVRPDTTPTEQASLSVLVYSLTEYGEEMAKYQKAVAAKADPLRVLETEVNEREFFMWHMLLMIAADEAHQVITGVTGTETIQHLAGLSVDITDAIVQALYDVPAAVYVEPRSQDGVPWRDEYLARDWAKDVVYKLPINPYVHLAYAPWHAGQ